MNLEPSTLIDALFKSAIVVFALNEIRGLVLAGPVLYGMYLAGGTFMAIWIGFCSLAGIAISVLVPAYAAKRLGLLARLQRAGASPHSGSVTTITS